MQQLAIAGLSLHDRSERNTSADREFRKAADVGKRVAAVDKAIHIKASFAGLMKSERGVSAHSGTVIRSGDALGSVAFRSSPILPGRFAAR